MKTSLFFLALITALILEGTGLRNGREIGFWIVIFLPIAAYFLFGRGKITHKIGLAYLIFIIISAISTAFSSNLLLSMKFLLLYTSCGFAFLIAINHKQIFEKVLTPLILSLSVFFCIYSIYVINFVARTSFIEPNSGSQLVYPLYNSHNHLGDLLLLPLIICLYYLLGPEAHQPLAETAKRKLLTINYLLLTTFFLPFFLFSFSRSAYVSLVVCAGIMIFKFIREKNRVKFSSVVIFLIFSLSCVVFFMALMFGRYKSGLVSNVYNNLLTNHELSDNRLLLGARDRYAQHALLSTVNHPLLGVGPGNYIVASKKYIEKSWQWTDTSHNIFLDILSENGIPALIVFVYIFYLIFKKADRNLYFYLSLVLFLDFQTDYTYRMYSLFLLFIIFLGLSYKENDDLDHSSNSD